MPNPHKFEDYILTYEVNGSNSGLFPITNDMMEYLSSTAGDEGVYDGGAYLDIGFGFPFDEEVYSSIYVRTSGWCVLVDPENYGSVVTDVVSETYDNATILSSIYNKHVLLAPWFSDNWGLVFRSSNSEAFQTFNTTNGEFILEPPTVIPVYSEELLRYMSEGRISYPPIIDPLCSGVKFYRGSTIHSGKCLVVRYKIMSLEWNVLTFDVVLHESGIIEFRYDTPIVGWNVDTALSPLNESATVGIFANKISENRYRDFSIALTGGDTRGVYENGGAIWDGSYQDEINNTTYMSSLNSSTYWPGKDQIAAFVFSPATNRKRMPQRAALRMRDSEPFIKPPGLFNDQLTNTTSNVTIQYPSMLPVSSKISPYTPNSNFQSGSIEITRTISPGLYDSILYDSIIEARKNR